MGKVSMVFFSLEVVTQTEKGGSKGRGERGGGRGVTHRMLAFISLHSREDIVAVLEMDVQQVL